MKKVGLKLNIEKTKIMVSGPITSWQVDEENVETVADFILGDSKITGDGDWTTKQEYLKKWPWVAETFGIQFLHLLLTDNITVLSILWGFCELSKLE